MAEEAAASAAPNAAVVEAVTAAVAVAAVAETMAAADAAVEAATAAAPPAASANPQQTFACGAPNVGLPASVDDGGLVLGVGDSCSQTSGLDQASVNVAVG